MKLIAIMLCSLVACAFSAGPADSELTTPTVLSSVPADGAIGVALGETVSATFSEAMDPATLTATTVTLTAGASSVPIPGTVRYADSTVVFTPAVDLVRGATYTATISTGASSDSGVALAAEYVWAFTGEQVISPGGDPVNLGTAGKYVVLAAASISGTGAVATGDLGISPAAASYITGFSLIADLSTEFSTSAQVTGKVYASDYGAPTPAILGIALDDMLAAYTEAAGRPPGMTELGLGNLGGMTLAPGVYRWTSDVTIPMSVTLMGRANDVWIFQIAGTLGMSASTTVTLAGGALARNVFWQVSGAVTVGASAHLQGVVLGATAFTSGANTSITGRVLSQTDVTITGSTLVQPAP